MICLGCFQYFYCIFDTISHARKTVAVQTQYFKLATDRFSMFASVCKAQHSALMESQFLWVSRRKVVKNEQICIKNATIFARPLNFIFHLKLLYHQEDFRKEVMSCRKIIRVARLYLHLKVFLQLILLLCSIDTPHGSASNPGAEFNHQ